MQTVAFMGPSDDTRPPPRSASGVQARSYPLKLEAGLVSALKSRDPAQARELAIGLLLHVRRNLLDC